MNTAYDEYRALMRRAADVKYASDLLQWDQEVYMPAGGAAGRARQVATLAGIHHELFTDAKVGAVLDSLLADDTLSPVERANVRESHRKYSEMKKYPNAFVVKLNETTSAAFQAWQEARGKKDFALFRPLLATLVDMKRQECDLLGYAAEPYDALLNLFEPGSTTAALNDLFNEVRSRLVPFAHRIAGRPRPDTSFLHRAYDKKRQWDFGMDLLERIGYDFRRGRQDVSAHPFTTNFNAGDVRITTRIDEHNFREMTWSTLHECGHGLYEQGLPAADYGLPSGEYLSLAIHESQSRIWENNVGRSLPFWTFHYPRLQAVFPENLAGVPLDAFYRAINTVEPSLIRTNADEITYHLHILIRFELETALLAGTLAADDLPAAWNERYRDYLGLDVPDDAAGVLQDVHWSHGAFGYFPTYTQGSVYAAQFFDRARRDMPTLEDDLRKGHAATLLDWLRTNIHRVGHTVDAGALCRTVTGRTLDFSIFMQTLETKYETLYALD